MIIQRKLDISTVTTGLVCHGVNCLSVMGAGVALAIAIKWPNVNTAYRALFSRPVQSELLGTVQFVDVDILLTVANCFTQIYTGFDTNGNPPANIDAIRKTLEECVKWCNDHDEDMYTPLIGCGLGGLSWESEVKAIYEDVHEGLNDNLTWTICVL